MDTPIPNVLDTTDVQEIAYTYAYGVDDITPEDIEAIRKLVKAVAKAEVKRAKVEVEYVEGQPYASADELREDVAKGILRISTDFNVSPLLGEEINLLFRVAHDLHHAATATCNFELWGECCAFAKFAALAKGNGRLINILFSEIVAQVCFLRVFSRYTDQRMIAHAFRKYALQVCQAYGVEYKL